MLKHLCKRSEEVNLRMVCPFAYLQCAHCCEKMIFPSCLKVPASSMQVAVFCFCFLNFTDGDNAISGDSENADDAGCFSLLSSSLLLGHGLWFPTLLRASCCSFGATSTSGTVPLLLVTLLPCLDGMWQAG